MAFCKIFLSCCSNAVNIPAEIDAILKIYPNFAGVKIDASTQLMAIEIERKFLVAGDYKKDVYKSEHIVQGYICSQNGRTVRVRLRGEKAYITIKTKSSASGMSRFEWEVEIPVKDAEDLLAICTNAQIDKTRHLVKFGGHVFEIDEFHADNEGLVVAEIELTSEDEQFERPQWLGKEVTGDRRYYNSALLLNPYKLWQE